MLLYFKYLESQYYLEIMITFDFSLTSQLVLTDVCIDISWLLLDTLQPCTVLPCLTLTWDWVFSFHPLTTCLFVEP